MKLIAKLSIIGVLVAAFTATPLSAQTLKKIRIGYPSLSFRQSNVWVAKEMGIFNKYGLEVEPIFLRGGQMATLALVAGDPPIVNIGTVIQANLVGSNLVLVAAVENELRSDRLRPPRHNQTGTTQGEKLRHQWVRLCNSLCIDHTSETPKFRPQGFSACSGRSRCRAPWGIICRENRCHLL